MAIQASPSPGGATTRRDGYWLIRHNGGAGILKTSGPANDTPNAVYLGATATEVDGNLPHAVNTLHAYGLEETPGGLRQLVANAMAKGAAWYGQTPSNIQPDNITLYGTAVGFASGPIADFLSSAADAAGLDDPFAKGPSGAPKDAASDAFRDDNSDPTTEDDPNAKDDNTDPNNKVNPLSAGAGALAFLTDAGTWIRLAEIIGGILLLAMGLKSMTGNATVNPIELVPSSARKAAAAAAVA